MKISIASDHAGFKYKTLISRYLQSKGHEIIDFGTDSEKSVDYPDFIKPAAVAVSKQQVEVGVVLGGSGNGEAIAANKVNGIRCAVCWNVRSAILAKEHNNANLISIGQRMVTEEVAIQMVDAWLNAKFEGGRHLERITKIEMA